MAFYGGPSELSQIQSGKKGGRRRSNANDERREVAEFTRQLRLDIDAAYKATEDWRRKALESYGFAENEQWDQKDIEFIRRESPTRPIMTFNDILPVIRILSGIERQNRQDFKIVPRAGGDVDAAQVMTELFRYVGDRNQLFYQRIRKSNDVNITGRGYLCAYYDFDTNVHGDIYIKRRNPLSIFNDPMADDWDGTDRKWTAEGLWVTEDEAKEMWPDFADQIQVGDWLSSGNNMAAELTGDRHADLKLFLDPATKRVRIFDYWYKRREQVTIVVNLDTGDAEPLSQKFVDSWQTMDGFNRQSFRFIKRRVEVVRLATFCHWLLLQDKPSPLPHNFLPTTPYIGLQYYNEPKGPVEYLKDPARLKNKSLSQMMNHLNRSANSGWKNHATQGADSTVLEKFGSVPGVVIDYKDIPPEQIDPTQISPAHLTLYQIGGDQIKTTSSVNAEIQGLGERKLISGKAIEARQQGGMTGNEDLFDNGLLGDKLLGLQLIPMIQETFPPERVRRVVEDLGMQQEKSTAAMLMQRAGPRLPQIIDSALKNEYDYIVDRSAALASVRQEQTAHIADILEKMAKHGPVPPSLLKAVISGLDGVEQSDKDEALAWVDRMTGIQQMQAVGEIGEYDKRAIAAA